MVVDCDSHKQNVLNSQNVHTPYELFPVSVSHTQTLKPHGTDLYVINLKSHAN